MQGLRVLMLGQGRIELDGHALTRLLAPKQQAIVYYLAWACDAVPRSRLATLLWGGLAKLRSAMLRSVPTTPSIVVTSLARRPTNSPVRCS